MSTPSQKSRHINFTLFWLWISILIFAASNAVVAKIGELGAMHLTPTGHNPISFCNLFFAGNMVAGITLLIVYRKDWRLNELKEVPISIWIYMLVLILLAGVLSPAFYFIALMLTEVTNVVLISTVDVPLSLLFAFLLFREKARVTAIIGSLIAFGGVILIFFLGPSPIKDQMTMKMLDVGNPVANHFLQTLPKGGEILTGLATLMSIISVQLSRKLLQNVSVGVFSVMRMIVGVILFAIIIMSVFGVHHFNDLFSPFLWQWMLVYGAIIIVIGQITWFKGVKKASSADISMATALTPIAGTLFAYLILREIPNSSQIIGGIIILFGIGISLFGEIREQRRKAKHEQPCSFKGV